MPVLLAFRQSHSLNLSFLSVNERRTETSCYLLVVARYNDRETLNDFAVDRKCLTCICVWFFFWVFIL